VAVFDRILRPPISHVKVTAAIAPTKARARPSAYDAVTEVDDRERGASRPEATPSRYGSASGFRKTPGMFTSDRQHRPGQQSDHIRGARSVQTTSTVLA